MTDFSDFHEALRRFQKCVAPPDGRERILSVTPEEVVRTVGGPKTVLFQPVES